MKGKQRRDARDEGLEPLGDEQPTRPVSAPLVLTSVWQCRSTDQAEALLSGEEPGYIYRRDNHPNADRLAALCRERHGAEWAFVTSSGMAALAAVLLAELRGGDHVLLSRELYGKTHQLFFEEGARWGLEAELVDAGSLNSLEQRVNDATRMLVVETISNPMLRVADIGQLADWCRSRDVVLVVDHTFGAATPFRPLASGASYVVESLTKFVNGHSDVVLGIVAGRGAAAARVDSVVRTWGMVGAPLDCWLTERGAQTLDVRADRACGSALEIARRLAAHPSVNHVSYPGLEGHPDHETAAKQFGDRFGTLVTCTLAGGRRAVDRFVRHVPFCPSLGESVTTVSHPRSTSHRGLSAEACRDLGIEEGTIRLSVGCEPLEKVWEAIARGLSASAQDSETT